jgi:hypothetical protein
MPVLTPMSMSHQFLISTQMTAATAIGSRNQPTRISPIRGSDCLVI